MRPYHLNAGEGEAIWMFDALDTVKASAELTGGGFALVEFQDFDGSEVPLHVHRQTDCGFYVINGRYSFLVGDDKLAAKEGAWIFAPRGTPKAWRCNSPQGRVLSFTTPAGFEGFYREVGERVDDRTQLPDRREPDIEALVEIAARYDVAITGPPPPS